jgi:hypothetical protein
MDVRMPDGTVIKNVPEGITRSELERRYKGEPKVAADPGHWGAFSQHARGTFDNAAAGIKQKAREYFGDNAVGAVDRLGTSLGMADGSKLDDQQVRAQEKARLGKISEQYPVISAFGAAAPLVAAVPAVGSLTAAAGLSAVPGLISYGSDDERLESGMWGAAGGFAGAGAGKLLGRALNPIRTPITQSRKAATEAAERLGVDLRASEKTGSRALGWAEGSLNDLPFSGGMAQSKEAARNVALSRAAARSIGQQADEITPDVLAAARRDTGAVYQSLVNNNRQIVLDGTFRSEVNAIKQSKVMKALQDQDVSGIVAPFQNMPKGTIKVTGEWFQQNKTALDNAIRGAYTRGEPGKAIALEKFEDALEAAAARSMTATERAAFKTGQKQWANLRMLETGQVVEAGKVLPGRLNQAMHTRYGAAMKEGKISGELADIAKLGETFKPLPQSGTAPRAAYSAVASGAGLLDPTSAALMFGAPPALQKFMQSKGGQHYLTKGVAKVSPEAERLLMQSSYGLFGLPFLGSSQ